MYRLTLCTIDKQQDTYSTEVFQIRTFKTSSALLER